MPCGLIQCIGFKCWCHHMVRSTTCSVVYKQDNKFRTKKEPPPRPKSRMKKKNEQGAGAPVLEQGLRIPVFGVAAGCAPGRTGNER